MASLKDRLDVLQIARTGVSLSSCGCNEHRKTAWVVADRNCAIEQNDKNRSYIYKRFHKAISQ